MKHKKIIVVLLIFLVLIGFIDYWSRKKASTVELSQLPGEVKTVSKKTIVSETYSEPKTTEYPLKDRVAVPLRQQNFPELKVSMVLSEDYVSKKIYCNNDNSLCAVGFDDKKVLLVDKGCDLSGGVVYRIDKDRVDEIGGTEPRTFTRDQLIRGMTQTYNEEYGLEHPAWVKEFDTFFLYHTGGRQSVCYYGNNKYYLGITPPLGPTVRDAMFAAKKL